jgi:hypothetical protein
MGEGTTSRAMVADKPYGEFMIITGSVWNILDKLVYLPTFRKSLISPSLDLCNLISVGWLAPKMEVVLASETWANYVPVHTMQL